jgi:hypothetical protein
MRLMPWCCATGSSARATSMTSSGASCSVRKLNVAASSEHGVAEPLPRRRGQAGVQRAAAVRVDVDAVALHPVGAGLRALGDLHLDARPQQPVGEAQAADAAADDENAEGFDHDARIINQTDE